MLVLGATGGVGSTAIQLGKLMGAKVIAAASSAAKLAVATELGADATIDCSREDLRERLKTLTGGKGVDVVYDPVGGELSEPALRGIAWRGRYLVIGFADGRIRRCHSTCRCSGAAPSSVCSGAASPSRSRGAAAGMSRSSGIILRPVACSRCVGEVHPLTDYRAAFTSLATRRARGKVVVRVSP